MTADDDSVEATVNGSFEILGQRQEVLAGASYTKVDGGGRVDYSSLISSTYVPYPGAAAGYPAVNVFSFNPYGLRYAQPGRGPPSDILTLLDQTISGAYVNVKLTAFDKLHLITGVRYSHFAFNSGALSLCTTLTGSCRTKQIGDPLAAPSHLATSAEDFSWPPTVSAVYDVKKAISVYATYTDIYVDQSGLLDHDLNGLPPMTGFNVEAGVKWQALDGKLNVSLADYLIQQKNYPIDTGDYGPYANNRGYAPDGYRRCCYYSDHFLDASNLSRGIDAEVTGEVLPGWQVSASYTWSKNEYAGKDAGSSQGQPFESRLPRSLYKLWTSYQFKGDEWLSRLRISGGLNGQSSAFRAGSACTAYNDPNPTTGAITCKTTAPYSFTQGQYALLSGRIDYRLSGNWNLALSGNNLTDHVYYQTTGGSSTSGNWYGEPRSYQLTLRGAF